jgi:hypothetical protein
MDFASEARVPQGENALERALGQLRVGPPLGIIAVDRSRSSPQEVVIMHRRIIGSALVLSLAVIASGCATSEEWAEWRSHSSHFASGQHATFSLKNREGTAPRVARSDIEAARTENWWGKAITVSPDQIFQN